MSPAWWDEVARFVDVLEATQQELLEALRAQRRALASVDPVELERLNALAGEAARRLQQTTQWRAKLLEQAAAEDGPAASLTMALGRTVSLPSERLRGRLVAVQQRFGEVRREAWIQWVVSHRSQSLYAEVLDLIAHGGQKSPVYEEGPQSSSTSGGVMLDAAA
jgi:hypothetical protein